MEPFRITLPSNSSSHEFAENTAANFKTFLAKPISLTGDWEVALTHMWFPASWYNVFENQYVGICNLKKLRDESIDIEHDFYDQETPYVHNTSPIRPGVYTIHSLIGIVNEKLQEACRYLSVISLEISKDCIPPKLHIDDVSHNINILLGSNGPKPDPKKGLDLTPLFSPYLCNLLGIEENLFKVNEELNYAAVKKAELEKFGKASKEEIRRKVVSARPYDISAGIQTLYVYTNIVQPTHVGDSYTQLLKAIPVNHIGRSFGEILEKEFSHPIFIPIQSNYIQMIEIDCKDDTGCSFPFEMGKTVVELFFRPKKL